MKTITKDVKVYTNGETKAYYEQKLLEANNRAHYWVARCETLQDKIEKFAALPADEYSYQNWNQTVSEQTKK